MSQYTQEEYFEEEGSQGKGTKPKGRSADYEKKRRRAEKILEQARLRELLGYDINYDD